MWAFHIIYDRPLGRSDWAFVLGWRQGPGCFIGRTTYLGLASGPTSPFFKPYQLPPSPCVRYAWARAITLLVSDVISTCLFGAGLVRDFFAVICLVIMMTFRFSRSSLPLLSVSFCFFRRYPLTVRLVCP